jgi:hypothetical protein
VFTWSASGNIITEALAARFPTLIVYLMDSVRSTSPVTFMSNMLYACSILYKCKLPFIVAMNKVDVVSHRYAVDWMQAVLGIRRIRMFLGLLDPDPLDRGPDLNPSPDPSLFS